MDRVGERLGEDFPLHGLCDGPAHNAAKVGHHVPRLRFLLKPIEHYLGVLGDGVYAGLPA